MKVIIIGGGACGASAAARLRRLDNQAEIIVIEKTDHVSIANCGLPYYCSNIIDQREKLLVSSPQRFHDLLDVTVHLNNEVTEIDRQGKNVILKNGQKMSYDKLILSTGAEPLRPDIPGINGTNIFTVRTISDIDSIKDFIRSKKPQTAVVVGGGFIGVEMAENLAQLGLSTTIVDAAGQILASFGFEAVAMMQNELKRHNIKLVLSNGVDSFSGKEIELKSGEKIPYDLVVLAIGVKPEISLAQKAGLDTNRGICVNEFMQTSDPDIYAGGDNVEINDFITNAPTLIPLAGPANRQGRIIADNIFGLKSSYKKSQGTAIIKIFDLTAACVGHNEKQLNNDKILYFKTLTFSRSHAGYYPDAEFLMTKLMFDKNGKILGAQVVGKEGVDKRIDVIATVMRNNGTIQDLVDAELCYAPPYSSAKDPVNIIGMTADNILKGFLKPAFFSDLPDSFLIDVRPRESFRMKSIPKAKNIPVADLKNRINDIPTDKKIILFCDTGFTSYVAARILMQNGRENVYSFMGGMKMYSEIEENMEK